MRIIDADAMIPMMKYATTDSEIGVFPIKIGFDAIVEVINSQPTIEPKQKTGRWIYGEDNPGTGRDGWFCSKCGHFEMWDYSADMKSAELNLPNYCPNCGADMRGENDGTEKGEGREQGA